MHAIIIIFVRATHSALSYGGYNQAGTVGWSKTMIEIRYLVQVLPGSGFSSRAATHSQLGTCGQAQARVNVSGGKPPTNSHVLNGLGNWEMKK